MPTTASRRRGRLVLLATFALFFLPVLAAWLLNVVAPDWRPFGQVNYGEILDPPPRLPDAHLPGVGGGRVEPPHLAGKWALVYVPDGPCAARCEHALDTMRRARLALGRDTPRVRRLLLLRRPGVGAPSAARPDDLDVAIASDAWLAALAGASAAGGRIYLVDPQGYLVMRHGAETPVRHLHSDLERLLDVSRIGRGRLEPARRRLARGGHRVPAPAGAVLRALGACIMAAAPGERAARIPPTTTPRQQAIG